MYQIEVLTKRTVEEVSKRMHDADQWNMEDCRTLCILAGMLREWNESDGDNFEDVIYQAAKVLGVEI